jgi:hypothetical protein
MLIKSVIKRAAGRRLGIATGPPGGCNMAKVRLNIEVSEELARLLDKLADEEDVTRTEIVRRALAVLKAYKDQIEVGRTHIGFARDADRLDLELIGVLTPPTIDQKSSISEEDMMAAE